MSVSRMHRALGSVESLVEQPALHVQVSPCLYKLEIGPLRTLKFTSVNPVAVAGGHSGVRILVKSSNQQTVTLKIDIHY